MSYYLFRQNNPGGRFLFDKDKGISTMVFVEAPTEYTGYMSWAPEGVAEGYVHHLDGRITEVKFVKQG